MDIKAGSRIHKNIEYPKFVYMEMVATFLGANFVYHKNVFRRNNNKFNFGLFLIVNAFTSYQLCEMANPSVLRHYAAAFNNAEETVHRQNLNSKLRLKLLGYA